MDIPYLRSQSFISRGMVAKGDELFLIDPRPFQRAVERLEAEAKALEAQVARWRTEQQRYEGLLAGGVVTREDYEHVVATLQSYDAQHEAALAQAAEARLKLEFCRITAPVNGQISRNLVSVGNLVSADATVLTTLVSVDPIYVLFHVEERVLQHYLRLQREGKLAADEHRRTVVSVGLDVDPPDQFPHQGYIDFTDNRVDPNTGAYLVRAVLSNPDA